MKKKLKIGDIILDHSNNQYLTIDKVMDIFAWAGELRFWRTVRTGSKVRPYTKASTFHAFTAPQLDQNQEHYSLVDKIQ